MPLPKPANGTDIYLAAIHSVLGEIRDRLPARAEEPVEGEPVELREPAPPAAPPRPIAEPARKPSARKTPAGAPRTRTRKGA